MIYEIVKVLTTTALVVLVSEVSRRSTLVGGVLASVPLVSVLAMVWLYAETRDARRVADLATSVFWLVIPSLALFLVLPVLIRRGVAFPVSLAISIAVTAVCYYMTILLLERIGVRL